MSKKKKKYDNGIYTDNKFNFCENKKKLLMSAIDANNFKIPFNDLVKLKYKNKQSNSWFKINEASYNENINLTKNNMSKNKIKSVVKCHKITILPSTEQKTILLNWFEAYRKMYNYAIYIIKELIAEKHKKRYDFKYIRTYKCTETKNELMKRFKINSHILDGAIKLACTSYKSATTNYLHKNIGNFRIRPIKQSKKTKILDIEQCYFFNKGFCKRILGEMKTTTDFNFNNVNHDSKLHYNSITNRFTLLVPFTKETIDNTNNNFMSIDPGLKTFLTGLSSDKISNIGTNLIKTIKTNLNKIDNLNKINNKKTRKRVNKLTENSYNLITDLHWKSINYIIKTTKVKHIFLGNWSTKSISSVKGNLLPIYKRIANKLRFHEFKQKLQYKCNEYNINLIMVDESYTSKVCSFCKATSEIGLDRKLTCNCGFKLDRDINGCINILLKGIQ